MDSEFEGCIETDGMYINNDFDNIDIDGCNQSTDNDDDFDLILE
jgi:hypothetical protein